MTAKKRGDITVWAKTWNQKTGAQGFAGSAAGSVTWCNHLASLALT